MNSRFLTLWRGTEKKMLTALLVVFSVIIMRESLTDTFPDLLEELVSKQPALLPESTL